jgi:hypothetical protein
MMETRRSISCPRTATPMRPSWVKPALGDVELGHDLQPRHHGGVQRSGLGLPFDQHAVEAIAHAQRIAGRLDMDVGGASLDGGRNPSIDQADHRRVACQIAQPLGILA